MAAVKGVVRLRVLAGQAAPSPAIGQALGPLGVNMMEFCKQFNNESSARFLGGVPLSVRLTALNDRTFSFELKTPSAAFFLKKCAGVEKGAEKPGQMTVGTVGIKHLYEIAKIKQTDTPHLSLPSVVSSLIGSAKSIGLTVVR